MSSVATVMLVDLFGEAGGFELAVLTAGAVLGVLLGGVARLGCSCGLVSHFHRVSGPVVIGDDDGVRGFVRPSEFHPGISLPRHSSGVCRGRPKPWQCSPTVTLRWSGLDGASVRVRFVGIVDVGGPLYFVFMTSS